MFRYKYTPIKSSNEIRLVTILPGSRGDPIRIQITHAVLSPPTPTEKPKASHLSLEEIQKILPGDWCVKETLEGRILFFNPSQGTSSWDHPDPDLASDFHCTPNPEPKCSELNYEALSYAWGPPRIRAKAYVVEPNDDSRCGIPRFRKRHIPLQRDLSIALRWLRYEDRGRVMWIDALCINQADHEERGVQVRRMGEIYSLARRVVVCLGPSFPKSAEVVSMLRRVGEQIEVGRDQSIMPSPGCEERDWYKPDVDLPYEIEDWEEIDYLLGEDWFRRLWVVQEIQLGSPSTILMCGHDELLWSTFRRACLSLNQKQEQLPRERLKWSLQLCTIAENLSLEHLLFSCRDRKCFDKRDKIYGVLSLAPPEIAEHIRVDYRETLLGVYEQVFQVCTEQTQRLTQLRYSGLHHKETTPKWPTWVPDWSQVGISVTIQPTECFRASGISASKARSSGPGRLEVTALRFATVSWVDGTVMKERYADFFDMYWDTSRQENLGYPTGEVFRDVLLQILTLNTLDDRTPGRGYPTLEELSKAVALSKPNEKVDWTKEEPNSEAWYAAWWKALRIKEENQWQAWKKLTGLYKFHLTSIFNKCSVFRTANGYLGMIRGVPQKGKLKFPAHYIARNTDG